MSDFTSTALIKLLFILQWPTTATPPNTSKSRFPANKQSLTTYSSLAVHPRMRSDYWNSQGVSKTGVGASQNHCYQSKRILKIIYGYMQTAMGKDQYTHCNSFPVKSWERRAPECPTLLRTSHQRWLPAVKACSCMGAKWAARINILPPESFPHLRNLTTVTRSRQSTFSMRELGQKIETTQYLSLCSTTNTSILGSKGWQSSFITSSLGPWKW